MAGRDFTPVMFALEKNVVHLAAHITFGASGVPTLDSKNSKGFCNVAQQTISFTATTAAGTTLSVVSSFVGLYPGMAISGGTIPAGTTIVSLNAGAGTLVLSQAATTPATLVPITATGGYVLTLGTQYASRLDTYPKLFGIDYVSDVSGLQGSVNTAASAPAAPDVFITKNQVSIAGQASITFVTGNIGVGTFSLINPANGEGLYLKFTLGNSTSV